MGTDGGRHIQICVTVLGKCKVLKKTQVKRGSGNVAVLTNVFYEIDIEFSESLSCFYKQVKLFKKRIVKQKPHL